MLGLTWIAAALFLTLAIGVRSAQSIILELEDEAVMKVLESLQTDPHRTPMLIEFYAPWCSHCKRMEPVLNQLADYVGDDPHIQIAKVNGARHTASAKKCNATSFPSFIYVKDGYVGHYHGPRSLDGLKAFVDRVKLPSFVQREAVSDLWITAQDHHHENVSFALFLPCSGIADSSCLDKFVAELTAFDGASLELSMQASLALVYDGSGAARKSVGLPLVDSAQLCKLDVSVMSLVPHCVTAPSVLQSRELLAGHIREFNFPLIATMDNHNFHRIANLNATMILTILDTAAASTGVVLKEMEIAAKEFETQHPDFKLALGVLDGKKFHSFCKLHGAFAPSMLVIDHGTERHAVLPLVFAGQASVRDQIRSVISKIVAGALVMEITELNPSLWKKIASRFERYMPWSLLLLLAPLVFGALSLLTPKPKPKQM